MAVGEAYRRTALAMNRSMAMVFCAAIWEPLPFEGPEMLAAAAKAAATAGGGSPSRGLATRRRGSAAGRGSATRDRCPGTCSQLATVAAVETVVVARAAVTPIAADGITAPTEVFDLATVRSALPLSAGTVKVAERVPVTVGLKASPKRGTNQRKESAKEFTALLNSAQVTLPCASLPRRGFAAKRLLEPPCRAVGRDLLRSRALTELHELLRRLSPARRRHAIQTMISDHGRLLLEAWMVTRGTERPRSSSRPSIEGEESFAFPEGSSPYARPRKLARRAVQLPSSFKLGLARESTELRDVAEAEDGGDIRGVLRYAQTSHRTGCTSVWYYSTVCFHSLHVYSRMHRDRADAVQDNALLRAARERVARLEGQGWTFDAAVRCAFAELGLFRGENTKNASAIGDGAAVLGGDGFLRFYAVTQLAGCFRTMIRGPCAHDVDVALGMRRRFLGAVGPCTFRSMSHSDGSRACGRLLDEYLAMHRECASSPTLVERAHRAFLRAERIAIDKRDAGAVSKLRCLLNRCGLGRFT